MTSRKYCGKLILLGEYTVLLGSASLAFPLKQYYGQWTSMDDSPYTSDLLAFGSHVKAELASAFDYDEYIEDVTHGLHFESSIPEGYGCGSSGAVVAAVYDRYVKDKETSLPTLQSQLASMECFFHSTSSGIDPLVIYMDQPLVRSGGKVHAIDLATFDLSKFYLLDSGSKRTPESLIPHFFDLLDNEEAKIQINRMMMIVNEMIEAISVDSTFNLAKELRAISEIQFEFFTKMVPDHIKEVWAQGLQSNDYYMKLSGAGGGGFFQVYFPEDVVAIGDYALLPLTY